MWKRIAAEGVGRIECVGAEVSRKESEIRAGKRRKECK